MSHHERPYGIGLAYRHLLHEEIFQHASQIDLLEVSTEDYLVRQRRMWADPRGHLLDAVVQAFPCVAHGISLSLGSVEAIDDDYLARTRALLTSSGIRHFSEHLAFQCMDGIDLTVFLCLPFDEVAVDWVARRFAAVRRALGVPIALENVSYYFPIPHSEFSEPEFLGRVLQRIDGTLLLDVTNVYNNCINHNQDPLDYIHQLPAHRVSQIHLAGGHFDGQFLIDSHSQPVMEPVWRLYEEALRHTAAEVVILERDENLRPFTKIVSDVQRARDLFYKYRSAKPPAKECPWDAVDRHERIAADQMPAADPTDARFQQLRALQRTIIRQACDADFKRRVDERPDSVRDDYPLDDLWFGRWRDCSPAEIDRLARRRQWFVEQDAQAAEAYRRSEWEDWAHVLAHETE